MTHVQPRLLGISSTRFDVEASLPPDPITFCEWIDVEIKATREPELFGGENFAVMVCSSTWIANEVAIRGGLWGHKYLIVHAWDHALVTRYLEALCSNGSGPDWPTVVRNLSRYLSVDTIDFSPDE